MNFESKRHLGYDLSLAARLIIGISLAIQAASDKEFQMLVIVMTTAAYVFWGILHHIISHDLSSKIVIEYVLMGSLGMSIMLFLFKGAA